jgi:hypothetical protein
MLHVVIKEIWSISSNAEERQCLRRSAGPLFYGGRRAAFDYAQKRAKRFTYHDFREDADPAYWWGRNDGDHVNYRFVVRPAPA